MPKIVICEYCSLEVHRGDYDYRLPVPQLDAWRALNTHLATCSKASEKIKALVRKSRGENKAHISNSNCVCCGKVQRADKIVPHILAKHSMHLLVASMPKDERKEALKYRLPVVKCYKDGSLLFRACLHCRKGCLATSVAKVKGDSTIMGIKRKENHAECIEHFDDYKSLFEMEDRQTDLPFSLYNCNDPENPVKRNYITLDDEEKERKRYITKEERKEMAKKAEENPPKPADEVVLEQQAEIEVLKKRYALLERQMDELEVSAKEEKKTTVAPPSDDRALKLLRLLANDPHEEYDLEEVYEEAERSLERFQKLEEELSLEHRKAMGRLHKKIEILQNAVAEKDKIIGTFNTVSFGYGGKAVRRPEESDSD